MYNIYYIINTVDFRSFLIGSLFTLWIIIIIRLLLPSNGDNNNNNNEMIVKGTFDGHEIDFIIKNPDE